MSEDRALLDEGLTAVTASLALEGYEVLDTLLVEGFDASDSASVRWRVEFVDARSPARERDLALVWLSPDGVLATASTYDEHGRRTLVSVLPGAGDLRRRGRAGEPFVGNEDYRRLVAAVAALPPAVATALREAASLPVADADVFALLGTPALDRHFLVLGALDLREADPESHERALRVLADAVSGAPVEWVLHRAAGTDS